MRNNKHMNSDEWADSIIREVDGIETNVDNPVELVDEIEAILHTAELSQLCEFGRF